jgi:flagellar biosynthetic protein FlhB
MVGSTGELAIKSFGTVMLVENVADVEHLTANLLYGMLRILAPFMAVIVGIALAANYLQVGFLFSSQPLAVSLDKINPFSGFKRIVSMKSVVKVAISAAKAALVGLVFYLSIRSGMQEYFSLGDCEIGRITDFLAAEAFSISIKAALILLVLGIADYAFQHRDHIKGLMMSKYELKEEYKEVEGSPLIKSRIKSAQRELARKRMMKSVPDADVVITNPVHLAVAIRYEVDEMSAPRVVAKGQRLLAERIKNIARDHGVPIYENKALARSLFELVEVDGEIPESLYRAVAEVLSYVYRLKGKVPEFLKNR